jgi:hypothetical protein
LLCYILCDAINQDVKELFDSVDGDSSGTLEKSELGSLVIKAGRKLSLPPGGPPFDLDADWQLMRKGAPPDMSDGVSFPMFEAWWKERTGLGDTDMVVLPEFIAARLTEQDAGGVLAFCDHRRGGADDGAGGAEVDVDDDSWAPRTIWVGGIPQEAATHATLSRAFSVAPVVAVHIRRKDPPKHCWALVSFESEEDAQAAALLGMEHEGEVWEVAMVTPERMRSLHARLVQVAQQIEVRRERRNGCDALCLLAMIEFNQRLPSEFDPHGASAFTTVWPVWQTTNRGRALWLFLGARLRKLLDIQKVWGEVHTMYESRDASIYDSMPLPPLIFDPDSAFCVGWDGLIVLLLVYLCVSLPLRACFGIEVVLDSPFFFVEVGVDLIFAVDILVHFRTAFVDHKAGGVLEERPRVIARHYLRSWFVLDLLACLPLQYILSEGGSAKTVKALRLLWLAKMLRLHRLERAIGSRLNSYGIVTQLFGIAVLTCSIVFAAHLLACFWHHLRVHKYPDRNPQTLTENSLRFEIQPYRSAES